MGEPGNAPARPVPNKRLSPQQSAIWNVAGAIEIVAICGTISGRGDMNDPVVLAIAIASSLLAVWLTRKWILSRLGDETIQRLRDRLRR